MSIDETLTHGVQREDNHEQALTMGVVSFALGLTAVMGGGVVSNAVQVWAFDIARQGSTSGGSLVLAMSSVPGIILGIAAVALGLVAARSSHNLASASGKAGAIIGILAVVGGVLWAVSTLKSDFY